MGLVWTLRKEHNLGIFSCYCQAYNFFHIKKETCLAALRMRNRKNRYVLSDTIQKKLQKFTKRGIRIQRRQLSTTKIQNRHNKPAVDSGQKSLEFPSVDNQDITISGVCDSWL